MAISQRPAIPQNDDDFEKLCRDLLRKHWTRPGLEIYGKRGERQDGVDLLDLGGDEPLFAAQCKLKEEWKSLAPQEIHDEVERAKKFPLPIGKYAILTTGKISTHAQLAVRQINQAHKLDKSFEVELIAWDQICDLLSRYPDVGNQHYSEVGLLSTERIDHGLETVTRGLATLTAQIIGNPIDERINEARDLVNEHQFQLATLSLNQILKKNGALTAIQRYRVLANLGAAEVGQGRPQQGARYFLEALGYWRDDERARTNEVYAYVLIGDVSTAHRISTELLSVFPHYARNVALWLTTAPITEKFADLKGRVPTVLRTDPEVALALARRATANREFEVARSYARAAAIEMPKWAQPEFVLGQIELMNAIRIRGEGGAATVKGNEMLEAARAHFTKSLDVARQDGDLYTQRISLSQGIDVLLFLNRSADAARDVEELLRLAPDDPRTILSVAQFELAQGRTNEGIALLARAYASGKHVDVAFLYARNLGDRGRPEDVTLARQILSSIVVKDLPEELWQISIVQTLAFLIKHAFWTDASEYLEKESQALEPVVDSVLRGYLAHYQGEAEKTNFFASQAAVKVGVATPLDVKEYLAKFLMVVGRATEALPFWLEVFDLCPPGFDPANLLNCAVMLKRDSVVLDTCNAMHARGLGDWNLVSFELPYLVKYDVTLAISRLQEYIGRYPDFKLAILELSRIGVLLNRPDLVRASLADLPSIEDLPLEMALGAVQVLKYGGGSPDDAVDYSYRYLRLHFGSVEAHQAFVLSTMPGEAAPSIPAADDAVRSGSAVCYRELPAGTAKWVVLEETNEPSTDFEEISLTSALARELLHKKQAETFLLAKGSVQDRRAEIVQIIPKYVRRFQDSMTEMQVRFGSASFVESFHTDPSTDSDDQAHVVLQSVERHALAVDNVRVVYRDNPLTLHLYGAAFGRNAYHALFDLAVSEGQSIKCSTGSPADNAEAMRACQLAKGIVLDLTALATIRLLGFERILEFQRYQFIVSQRTWIALHEMRTKARLSSAAGGNLRFEGGRYFLFEETAEDKLRQIQEQEEFLKVLEARTKIIPAPELAEVDPIRREVLVKLFGESGAESMLLAARPENVLWTDDAIHGSALAQEFGGKRVWTQVVIAGLANEGLISLPDYHAASARLVGFEFRSTWFDAETMFAAGSIADWMPHRYPLKQFIDALHASPDGPEAFSGLLVVFFVRLYREPLDESTRCQVMKAFVLVVAQKLGGPAFLRSLRLMSSPLFGLNVVGQEQFERCLDSSLRESDGPLVSLT